ncbi:MAG: HAD-IB family hydrolase [Candidatus Contendobacter sp.]|nr:HAD-IB family hydrolase [Candidatus Contendobacter sp.]
MSLAIFDLDNTLLADDSDYLWGQFLIEQGIVDGAAYERDNQQFYDDYRAGTLDIQEFLAFMLRPLAEHPLEQLLTWRAQFIEDKIRPILLPKAMELLARHRMAGDTLLIITATNRFLTAPIAELLEVPHLLATEVEFTAGRYTGRPIGIPCFQHGKVERLSAWLAETGHNLDESWFYSDSHNDLPLLGQVSYPVAVDPDATLAEHAQERGWPIISLRGE